MKTAAVIRKAQDKSIKTLAWISLFFAVLGGTAGAGAFLGTAVRVVLGWCDKIPWEWGKALPVVILIVLTIGLIIDLLIDLVPNQLAIWSAIFIPSVASAVPGGFGDRITGWAESLMDWVGGALTSELGSGAPSVVALGCVAAALVMARRVIRKAGRPVGM